MGRAAAISKDSVQLRERREVVLRAARRVFESNGLEGASIRLIAKAARCTTGSIYPYFKGKEEIYAELLSRSLEDYQVHLDAEVHAAVSAKDKFRSALTAHFDFYEARPSDMSLALYLFNGLKPQGLTRDLDARLNAQLAAVVSVFVEAVRLVGKLSRRQAEVEVGLHLAMLFGLLTLHHTKRTKAFHVDARALLKLHIDRALARLSA